jgi:hypothetical protein
LWLLLVIPPALTLFFWWAARARQRLLCTFCRGASAGTVDCRHFTSSEKNPLCTFDLGGCALDLRHRWTATWI